MEQNLGFISTPFLPLVELHLSSSSDDSSSCFQTCTFHFIQIFYGFVCFCMVCLFSMVWFNIRMSIKARLASYFTIIFNAVDLGMILS